MNAKFHIESLEVTFMYNTWILNTVLNLTCNQKTFEHSEHIKYENSYIFNRRHVVKKSSQSLVFLHAWELRSGSSLCLGFYSMEPSPQAGCQTFTELLFQSVSIKLDVTQRLSLRLAERMVNYKTVWIRRSTVALDLQDTKRAWDTQQRGEWNEEIISPHYQQRPNSSWFIIWQEVNLYGEHAAKTAIHQDATLLSASVWVDCLVGWFLKRTHYALLHTRRKCFDSWPPDRL